MGEKKVEQSSESTSTEETTEQDSTQGSEDAEGSKETPDITPGLFMNPAELDKLPENLREPAKAMHKRMQAKYTKKMQALSNVARKAAAFDELMDDPRFRTYMDNETSETSKETKKESTNGEGGDALRAMIREELAEVKNEFRTNTQQSRLKEVQEQARKEYAKFSEDYPQHVNYKEEMGEILTRNPKLSYEEAFILAAREDLESLGGEKVLKAMNTKKKANVGKPSGKSEESAPPEKPTLRQAIAIAKKKHGISSL